MQLERERKSRADERRRAARERRDAERARRDERRRLEGERKRQMHDQRESRAHAGRFGGAVAAAFAPGAAKPTAEAEGAAAEAEAPLADVAVTPSPEGDSEADCAMRAHSDESLLAAEEAR